jgi:inward rectifier potassium channel
VLNAASRGKIAELSKKPHPRFRRGPIVVDTTPRRRADGADPPPRMWKRGALTGLVRVGLPSRPWQDLYHRALTASWPRFLLIAMGIYLLANLAFAGLYWLQPGSIANARPGQFRDVFFFSVETFATIGYGVMSPATDYANTVMTAEALSGIMLVALTTGMMFARVSRPTARILFSNVAVVSDYDGVPTLMVRMANRRMSQIVQAEVALSVIWNEHSREGVFMRRFHDLKPIRARTPVFAMSFLAMHRIDETSPLFGATTQSLHARDAEILVTVSGLDETMGASVHARMSYLPDEIRFGHRYADIFGFAPDGRRAIDYRNFHATAQVQPDPGITGADT